MDIIVAVALAGATGLVIGVVIASGGRRSWWRAIAWPSRDRGHSELAAAALAVLHIGALVVDKSNTVVLCNSAGRAMGLVRGDQLAVTELGALAGDARVTGTVREAEVRLLHGRLSRDRPAVCARAASVGRGGHVALLVEDVTEQRRVADVRRDFLANVSHELKTPVGALSLLAEALLQASDDPPAVRRFVDRMQHEAGRLARLVQELIELSRLEAADPLPAPTAVPVGQVVAEAVDRTRLAATARKIAVATVGDTDASVLGNREQLVTALVNLIDNAIQYSPEHTQITVSVRQRLTGAPGHVDISVTDRGIGIADADLDRVFERFYRADPARSRATGGTGLGLAIVKHIVANHAGRIAVRSRAGHGSTFTLTLPTTADSLPTGLAASR